MEPIACRSTVQIAEDLLFEIARVVDNVTRAEARRFCIQLRELGENERKEAERLIVSWDGSPQQINRVYELARTKRYLIARSAYATDRSL